MKQLSFFQSLAVKLFATTGGFSLSLPLGLTFSLLLSLALRLALGLFLGFALRLALGFLLHLTLGFFLSLALGLSLRLALSLFLGFAFRLSLGFLLHLTLGLSFDLTFGFTLSDFSLSLLSRYLPLLRGLPLRSFFTRLLFGSHNFLRVGYPALSIYNKFKKSSELSRTSMI